MLRAGDAIHTFSSACATDNALYKLFREKPCVDMTSFEVDIEQCDELYDHVIKTIHPLRLGVYACMYVCMYVCIGVCVYVLYVWVYVCIRIRPKYM